MANAHDPGDEEYLPVPGRSPVPPMRLKRRRRRAPRAAGDKPPPRKPELSIEEILHWADLHHQSTGRWPHADSGRIPEVPSESWRAVNHALTRGSRGLAGGSSLARLLAAGRGVRNRAAFLPLFEAQILEWADAHHARTGEWPRKRSGPIPEAPGETWAAVDAALVQGTRSLPAGLSVARLLLKWRGVEYHLSRPRLTEEQILGWIDAYRARHGRWPTHDAGPVEDAPGETWPNLDNALRAGLRGLSGGSSVGRLLAERRGVRVATGIPRLTEQQILAWADTYHARHGTYPRDDAGPLEDAPGEKWKTLDAALRNGGRGLPGGSSLPLLLAEHRGFPYRGPRPPLTEQQILAWADAYRERTGKWPTHNSGTVEEAPEETWARIGTALRNGLRGLPGDSSVAKLLRRKRGHRHSQMLPRFSEAQILDWADAHHAACGVWPRSYSGPIHGTQDTWDHVDVALRIGLRGLPGGSSLARLLQDHRGVRNRKRLPPFTEIQVQEWAHAYQARTGEWPSRRSGDIVEAPGETWCAVDVALCKGLRGLPGGSSLARLREAEAAQP